jgi:catechol 2,3-dioxygenase-like lactoylglutathione lyase family enzyme
MNVTGIHHLTLTVADAEASAEWYQRLLGPAEVIRREGDGWSRVRMQWPSGVVIGVTRHDGTEPVDRFDHGRIGLDHVGLGCLSEADVRDWADHMDRVGIGHGPVETVPYGWAVTARDPDGIPVEFFCARP